MVHPLPAPIDRDDVRICGVRSYEIPRTPLLDATTGTLAAIFVA